MQAVSTVKKGPSTDNSVENLGGSTPVALPGFWLQGADRLAGTAVCHPTKSSVEHCLKCLPPYRGRRVMRIGDTAGHVTISSVRFL